MSWRKGKKGGSRAFEGPAGVLSFSELLVRRRPSRRPGGFNAPFLALLPRSLPLAVSRSFWTMCLFPSLVRGVAGDVTGERTRRHWLAEEPPGAVYSLGNRRDVGRAHARESERYSVITHVLVIHLHGLEYTLLSNPPKRMQN